MRKKMVAGNWKMNGQQQDVINLLKALCLFKQEYLETQCVVLPPVIYLPLVREYLAGSGIFWGAQNVYPQDKGAFTGEISGPMLVDYQCQYVLVGHSERRILFAEDEKFIAEKFHHVKEHGMIPILCVGETAQERKQGLTEKVIAKQLAAVVNNKVQAFNRCVIAYEPVWAIGTGQSATPEQVQEVHSKIRHLIATYNAVDAKEITLLYGGSVNENNAGALFAMPDVDGGLIGGASLNARQFVEIIKCIN